MQSTCLPLACMLAATLALAGCTNLGSLDQCSGSPCDAGAATDAGLCNVVDGEVAIAMRSVPQSLHLDFPNAPAEPSLDNAGACPITTGMTTEPSVGFVLVNATGAEATLSLWGDCRNGIDGINLAEYDRATVPSSASDLAACVGTAGVNYAGNVPTLSPYGGGSGYCNGLMADAGHGLAMPSCGRVAVVFQYQQHYPNSVVMSAGGVGLLE